MDSSRKKQLREEFFALAEKAGEPGSGPLAVDGLRVDPAFVPAIEFRVPTLSRVVDQRFFVPSRPPAASGNEVVLKAARAA